MYRLGLSHTIATASRPLRRLNLTLALLLVVGSLGYVQPQAAAAPPGAVVFQEASVSDATGPYLTFPFEIPETVVCPEPGDPENPELPPECTRPAVDAIDASMTAEFSAISVIPGGGIIGGDALEFDVTITNTSGDPNVVLSAFAFQSKFSESPALASRIGDKLFYGQTVPGSLDTTASSALGTVKKNGTSNGLFTGKWKGICINSSEDFIPEFNSGLEDESLECAGNRADTNFDGEPELQTGANMLGLRPGESQVIRLRLDSGTTDGALHVVEAGTLQGRVTGTSQPGPNGITYFVPTIDNTGIASPNVLAIPDFGDNKVLRNADGTFNPTFAPQAGPDGLIGTTDDYTFAGQQYLTLPRRNFAFTDIIGRNHSCATYGLTLGACSGGGSPLLNFLGTGDLVPGVQNFAAILRGYGEFYDPDGNFVPDENPLFPGDTRPNFPYNTLCENCGGRPYVPIAEFYVTNGDGSLTQQIVGGTYGDPVAEPYLATIDSLTAEEIKQEIIPEPDPGGPCIGGGNKPSCAQLGGRANAEFYDLTVVPGGGINGGDAVEFNIEIENTSTNPDTFLTAFNYQTKQRGLADIGVLDGYTQDRRDIRVANLTVPGYLPDCTSLDQGACWNAALGVGHFPNVIGNGLLFGQMVWTDNDAGREGPVVPDQVYVDPVNGIDPVAYQLESVKKNGPFSPILKGNVNFICVKSGLFDNDPDSDAACAGEPAILVDEDEPPVPSNIVNEGPFGGRLGLPPGQTQTVRIRMEFGDFRGAMLEIVAGTLNAGNVDSRYTTTSGLARFFDCSDQRELEFCHPHLVGTNIGYLPNTNANWLTPASLADIEYVIINQPGDAPTVMNFQQNFGYILAMAGFVPSAEFYAPDPNTELIGTPYEGVLIRQQVLGEYLMTPPNLAPTIVSTPLTTATAGQAYTYDVNANAYPGATYSLAPGAPSGMGINTTSGVISWTPKASGSFPVTVNASNAAGSASQSFTVSVAAPPTPVLDNFNRRNGSLGSKWLGLTSGLFYRIRDNEVQVNLGGLVVWDKNFNKNQMAAIKLVKVDPKGRSHALVLKLQNKIVSAAGIVVSYDAAGKKIIVQAKDGPTKPLRTVGSFHVGTVPNGTVMRAEARQDGKVYVFLGNQQVGVADAGSYFRNRGGYTGLYFQNAEKAVIDDYDAGNIGR